MSAFVEDDISRAVRTPSRADRDVHVNLRTFLTSELLASHRLEHTDFFIDSVPTENQRGVYGAATWHF